MRHVTSRSVEARTHSFCKLLSSHSRVWGSAVAENDFNTLQKHHTVHCLRSINLMSGMRILKAKSTGKLIYKGCTYAPSLYFPYFYFLRNYNANPSSIIRLWGIRSVVRCYFKSGAHPQQHKQLWLIWLPGTASGSKRFLHCNKV